MPRNGTGTYALPAGNPFITGSVISSTTMNNTLGDIASALTASVANDGQTPILANQNLGGYNLSNIGTLGADIANIATLNVGSTASVPLVSTTANTNDAASTEWVRNYAPSGIYTPTISNLSGALVGTPYGVWFRVGNIVHVSINIPSQPSGSGAAVSFQVSLPAGQTTNITTAAQLIGAGASLNAPGPDAVMVAGIVANPGRAAVAWTASGGGAGSTNISFSYEVH